MGGVRVLLTRWLFVGVLTILGALVTAIGTLLIQMMLWADWWLPVIAFFTFILLAVYAGVLWVLWLALVEVLEYKG